ncbi:MAG TPA: AMP-binding protein, partial [Chitinophagaceae bacterium]|nr:AMP-binding protein [Chitinophagaceae bacterium]
GDNIMMGYYKHSDLTAEVIIDGWFHTGDIATWVDDKFLKITDRKKEIFKTSGGKYVAPQPIENKIKESRYIEQMMVVGSNRKFTAALIVPAFQNLKNWCIQYNITFTTPEEMIKNEKIIAFYQQIIEKYNQEFNHVEQIKKFELLPHEWTIEAGELTPTLKLKRNVIMDKYAAVVDKIYA